MKFTKKVFLVIYNYIKGYISTDKIFKVISFIKKVNNKL